MMGLQGEPLNTFYDVFDQVTEFNTQALGIQQREIGLLDDGELRYAIKAMHEEAEEFATAHVNQDVVAAVDAVLDEIYFCIGFLRRMGLTPNQMRACMDAVHYANMQKKVGVQHKRGGDGVVDAVKPEGWTGPEEKIARILGG